MKDPAGEARRWMAQARHDLEAARANNGMGFHGLACYLSQQAADKAVKAVLYASGERWVPGHSVVELLARAGEAHPEMQSLRTRAADLDKLYIPTRYPNGLPGGVPAESFSEQDGRGAIDAAEAIARAAAEAGDIAVDEER